MSENPDEAAVVEAARLRLRESIERAKALVIEARQIIGEEPASPSPEPASQTPQD